MEQIIITRRDGSTYPLAVKREATAIKSASQSWALLGDDIVNITIESPHPQSYEIGDRFNVFGRDYKLNTLPRVKKQGTYKFTYDLTFEGVQYDLLRAIYDVTIETTGNTLQDVQGDALTGDLRRFATVLVSNANRVFPDAWRLGECPQTIADKTLTFGESDNCLAVFQNLCKTFEVEADITQVNGVYTINFYEARREVHPFTFEFGMGKGLYALERQNVDSSNIVTRLKVYGSTDNITNRYRANRLCLPGKSKAQSFIEKEEAVRKYGIHEARKLFEDIKPTFDGRVTSIIAGNVLQFRDENMFDLTETEADGKTTKYLVSGVSAKIHFNTGNLAGYEFDVHKYDHATRTFTLKKLTDDRGDVFPSETSGAFQFGAGDEYKILDVTLPERYQNEAEQKLHEQGEKYYEQNSQPKVKYALSVTKMFLRKLLGNDSTANIFTPGDYIKISDESIGVNKAVRIQSFQRNLLDVYDYTLTISDAVESSITTRVISELIEIDKITTTNNLKDPTRAKANWRSSRELMGMIFDPDGDYYTDKIKPNSIDTLSLSVGAKSMQFGLQGVVFEPNYNGNSRSIKISPGTLVHYTIEEQMRSWRFKGDYQTLHNAEQAYYIYAKCGRTNNAGVFVFSSEAIKVEQDPNYYHFWIGVINSVDEDLGARSISLTYGFSMINGRFIKTGRIEGSGDGTCYFDLDNDEIGGVIKFVSKNGGYRNVTEIEANASEAKDYINNTLPGLLDDIQAQLDGKIEQFFYDHEPTEKNAPANEWTDIIQKEEHLGDLFYNTETGKVFRWVKSRSSARGGWVYHWQLLQDNEVAQALALANDALALSAQKRRIFTETPRTPYEAGDLWVQGKSGDIMRCVVARASGSYSASDWEKASNYTNDAALTTFINDTYTTAVNDLINQIDGKVESWFQASDPATSWATNTEKAKHVGDMWYNSASKKLKRYSSTYAWIDIEDKTAIDAYNAASTAQDTADGKRRVFVTQPYPPYDVGDLWVNGTELRRCSTARGSGSYNANDFITCVAYDNTKTVIDGGLVTSGTIQVAGSDTQILAGMTGNGTAADSVRFWAGATFENRAKAPYRVLQDGTVVMEKAVVKGEVHASSGTFKNVTINGSLRNAFSRPNDSFDVDYNDNAALLSSGGGWLDAYGLPWDLGQNGRRITLVNYMFNGVQSYGAAAISAPSGKYFYENGISTRELKISREAVVLLGYGDSTTFLGWIVIQRINLMTAYAYGRQLNILAQGIVTGTNSGASIKFYSFDGKTLTVSRLGEGRYRINLPTGWFYSAEDYLVMMTGLGYCYGTTTAPIKATLISRNLSYFDVDTSDDATRNDGSFMFQITNMKDWT